MTSPAFLPPHPSLTRPAPLDRVATDPRRRLRTDTNNRSVTRCSKTLPAPAPLPPADLPPSSSSASSSSTRFPLHTVDDYLSFLSVPVLLPRITPMDDATFQPLPPSHAPPTTSASNAIVRSFPTAITTKTTLPETKRPRVPPGVKVTPPDLRTRTYLYNRSLNRMCRRRRALHPCLAVLAEMRLRGIPLDKYTYSAVLTAAARSKARDAATELYHQIRSDGVELDNYLRAALLKIAGSGDRPQLDLCVRLFRGGSARPSRVMCNVMMDAYANAGRIDDCLATFRYMQGLNIAPDGYSVSAMTKGYVAAGRLDDALDNLAQARTSGLDVPSAACGQVMDALGKRGDLAGAIRVFDLMTLWRIQPTQVTFNILVGACAAAGDVRRAFEVYDEMRHTAGIPGDRFTLHALMRACLADGLGERALALYRELRQGRFMCNQVSYRFALVAAGMALDGDAVEEIVADMHANGCSPRMDTAASAVAACIRCADLQGARVHFLRYAESKEQRRRRAGEADMRQMFGVIRESLRQMEQHLDDDETRDYAQTARVVDELERRWMTRSA